MGMLLSSKSKKDEQMVKKRIKAEDALLHIQEFAIEEYEDRVVIERLLSAGVENVDVPAEINGKPVTAIGDECFFDCQNLKAVNLPDSVVSIGAQAFALCKSMTEIVLPDSVKEIGPLAFRDCRGLKKVVMPKGLKRIPIGCFSFCYLHEPEIILQEGLEEIAEGAFWSAGVFDLYIPDSVRKIGVGAFNWGPHPVTKLPYSKGWFSQWPFGERVVADNVEGEITDLHYLEGGCRLHEVSVGSEVKLFVYPCDYLDGVIQFATKENRQRMEKDVEHLRKSENALPDAYKIRDAWKRGFVEVR